MSRPAVKSVESKKVVIIHILIDFFLKLKYVFIELLFRKYLILKYR